MASQTWNAAGTYSWQAPPGVTQVDTCSVQDSAAGGGKGYGGSSTQTLTYTARHTYAYEGTNADSSPNPGYSPGARMNTDGSGYQGDDQLGDNGNTSTFITWPTSVPSDISGGTITDIKLTLNNNHSWYNSGMTYAIGKTTATPGGSSRPAISDPDQTRGTTAEGQTNTISLSGNLTPFINALGAGDAFVLYHAASSRTFYGYIAGAGQSGPPKLIITISFTTTFGGGGGGGGGFSTGTALPVTPGSFYPVTVGAGGLPGGNDQPSADGQPGSLSSFSGDTDTVSGTATASPGLGAGSGGAGAGGAHGTGPAGNGNNGSGGNASQGGAGGKSGDLASPGGAASTGLGNDGTGPGAAGGGGYSAGSDGGFGQDGYVTITWTPITSFSISSADTVTGADTGHVNSTGATSADVPHGTEGVPVVIGIRAQAGGPRAPAVDLEYLTTSEAASIVVAGSTTPSDSDIFTGADAGSVGGSTPVSSADTIAGSDVKAGSPGLDVLGSDAFTGTDAGSVGGSTPVSSADTGSAADGGEGITGPAFASDDEFGHFIDGKSLFLADTDTAHGSDVKAGGPGLDVLGSDSLTAADAGTASVGGVPVSSADAATLADGKFSSATPVSSADTGSAADTGTASTSHPVSSADSGGSADTDVAPFYFSAAAWITAMHGQNASATAGAFNNTAAFSISQSWVNNQTPSSLPSGFVTTPMLKYTSYAQFHADVSRANFTENGVTYTPSANPIGAAFTWIMYDNEYWGGSPGTSPGQTPWAEVDDPWTYMGNFITYAHAHGFLVMCAPGRDMGNDTTSVNPKRSGETLDAWYIRTNIAGAMAGADIAHVQTQADSLTIANFTSLHRQTLAQVQAVSPSTPVSVGVSTAYGTSAQMAAAAQSVLPAGYWVNMNSSTEAATAAGFLADMGF